MKMRFSSYLQSPDANEGTLPNSSYSTERSPKTALLFVAKRNILLPLIRLEDPRVSKESHLVADCYTVERSFRGH
jgi:hypothetical protein